MPPPITVEHIGVRHWHEVDYVVDRPRGLHCYLFLNFLTPMKMKNLQRGSPAPETGNSL